MVLQECSQRANNGRFSLRDLLMVPMQRVLKYHLLLQVLIFVYYKECLLSYSTYIAEVLIDFCLFHAGAGKTHSGTNREGKFKASTRCHEGKEYM